MKMLMNHPIWRGDDTDANNELRHACDRLCLDGVELICDGGTPPDRDLVAGYHLNFWPDWVDFWRDDKRILLQKFGSAEAYREFYGGEDGACLVSRYLADMERAASLGAQYVVFHVSDVSIEEGYTYRWEHSDDEVIDASCELINMLTRGRDWPFTVLLENQWWPGLTLTDVAAADRLLTMVESENKGLLLDTGHLMNTNTALRNEAEAVSYIHGVLNGLGALAGEIKGMHLHKSLSGDYVRAHTGRLPEALPKDYVARFCESYSHILRIDRHEPWTEPAIGSVIERLNPLWLTHELAAGSLGERESAVALQLRTLGGGSRHS